MAAPIRIGNFSGFYGDRLSALSEMLEGGGVDVLTGDYLAELTMLILGRDRLKDPSTGYAKTFLQQLQGTLSLAKLTGTKIVTNAGGLNPSGLAAAIRVLAHELDVDVRVAHVEGDDIVGRAVELGLPEGALAANAYLGAWGIVEALNAGADIVVTGRVTDASLIVGPAAAHFGWSRTCFDQLAGAVVAGHAIECGTQVTGGNYAFFTEIKDLVRPGFPIAQISADGSSVITKHAGTGGEVSVGTVTAQLLYEIGGPSYLGPDVVADFSTISLADDGPDRVRISGVRGSEPPATLKVGINSLGGFRNEATFVLTGLDIEAKAELIKSQLADLDAVWTLARTDHADAPQQEAAAALLHCVVRSADAAEVGRAFSSRAVDLALASYPGYHLMPPGNGSPYGVFSAAYVEQSLVPHVVVLDDDTRLDIPPAPATARASSTRNPEPEISGFETREQEPTRRVALGSVFGARSGDKGGSANVGIWGRSAAAYHWLAANFTVDLLKELLPETAPLTVHRYEYPRLLAVNFLIEGILGQGVAENVRHDPQAKAIGEWLRSRYVDLPEELLS